MALTPLKVVLSIRKNRQSTRGKPQVREENHPVHSALHANKSETYCLLKFTLEVAGERTHGYAL
ncbi:MAG: hypothetical protein ACI92Z_002155, partial [Paracoccaceae bacterium]